MIIINNRDLNFGRPTLCPLARLGYVVYNSINLAPVPTMDGCYAFKPIKVIYQMQVTVKRKIAPRLRATLQGRTTNSSCRVCTCKGVECRYK
jgi:hypothetical protein